MSVDDWLAEFPELANARVTFGLSEKKRQRCAELLEQGKEWPEIARDVGWECETLKRYYYRIKDVAL